MVREKTYTEKETNLAEVSPGRVVLRGYNNSNSQGGVACANCNNDSSNTNANNGSRLANNKGKSRNKTKTALATGDGIVDSYARNQATPNLQ